MEDKVEFSDTWKPGVLYYWARKVDMHTRYQACKECSVQLKVKGTDS